ncbi:hypothetical protein [Oxalicibacterium faecigallinarum]|uniref:Uncharacterized protein n=1 Tax=Oxalicibacterium faecigallinarum TaxID=573741 RepID=A0A8J3ARG5_9BURK|nr:hypothetical protein [Oxalicibacterium faecigallinarum]GGI19152.1 hypothetical protein GCM10008066_17650 [Oxalicibacterium faecigallinarum]
MLLSINTKTKYAERRRTKRLQSFGFDELALQAVFFRTLDRLFPDDKLILLTQSRAWQEEPDLMAIDKDGNLFIFELKVWESRSDNLLQVLRYGQLFGNAKYADLDSWYRKFNGDSQSLEAVHASRFGVSLPREAFNTKQTFVVITNGLDRRTREAARYWRSCGLDVRPWVYRVYDGAPEEMLLEMSAFRVGDNPYEDLAEGYYILNTNISNTQEDHDDMVANGKAAAYFDPWKFKIERLVRGDVVFLYQSGVGIVGVGEADGQLQKQAYQGDPKHKDEEYFMMLNRFERVSPPLTAAEIKSITGINHRFMSTMFGLDAESGKAVRKFLYEKRRDG